MTLQRDTPEIKPTTPGSDDSGGVPGLPLPPTPPRAISRAVMILWLVVIGMAVFFLPLYLAAMVIREDAKSMDTEIASIRVFLTKVPTPEPEIASQMTPLAQAQRQVNQLNRIYPTLIAPHPDLPAVMAAINNNNPNEIALTGLTLADNRITLNGRATRDEIVLTYVHNLEQTNLFDRVILQSAQVVATITPTLTVTPTVTALPTTSPPIPIPTITLAPTITGIPSTNTPSPTPTSTPTLTPSSTPTVTPTGTTTSTSTPSATPDLRDAYEPDDVTAHPIAIGETQQHNFFPTGDIDKVSFAIKSLRYYQVLTSDLALGVDTVATVTLGGSVLGSNDDYAPGSGNFASAVCFQAPQDGTAAATIVNTTGLYAPDKTYKIKVSEVLNLNVSPCTGATATPAAMQVLHPTSSARDSLTDFSSLRLTQFQSVADWTSQTDKPARLAPMPYRFVITLDLKVTTP